MSLSKISQIMHIFDGDSFWLVYFQTFQNYLLNVVGKVGFELAPADWNRDVIFKLVL